MTTHDKADAEARFRRWLDEQSVACPELRRRPLYEQLYAYASDVLGGWR